MMHDVVCECSFAFVVLFLGVLMSCFCLYLVFPESYFVFLCVHIFCLIYAYASNFLNISLLFCHFAFLRSYTIVPTSVSTSNVA